MKWYTHSQHTAFEVWEWTSNFIPHFIMDVTTYPCRDQSQSMLKKGPRVDRFYAILRVTCLSLNTETTSIFVGAIDGWNICWFLFRQLNLKHPGAILSVAALFQYKTPLTTMFAFTFDLEHSFELINSINLLWPRHTSPESLMILVLSLCYFANIQYFNLLICW